MPRPEVNRGSDRAEERGERRAGCVCERSAPAPAADCVGAQSSIKARRETVTGLPGHGSGEGTLHQASGHIGICDVLSHRRVHWDRMAKAPPGVQ